MSSVFVEVLKSMGEDFKTMLHYVETRNTPYERLRSMISKNYEEEAKKNLELRKILRTMNLQDNIETDEIKKLKQDIKKIQAARDDMYKSAAIYESVNKQNMDANNQYNLLVIKLNAAKENKNVLVAIEEIKKLQTQYANVIERRDRTSKAMKTLDTLTFEDTNSRIVELDRYTACLGKTEFNLKYLIDKEIQDSLKDDPFMASLRNMFTSSFNTAFANKYFNEAVSNRVEPAKNQPFNEEIKILEATPNTENLAVLIVTMRFKNKESWSSTADLDEYYLKAVELLGNLPRCDEVIKLIKAAAVLNAV